MAAYGVIKLRLSAALCRWQTDSGTQLASKNGVCEKTIRRDLEGLRYVHKIAMHKDVTIQMDTTYWGSNFGLMVIKDALRGVVLWHKTPTLKWV